MTTFNKSRQRPMTAAQRKKRERNNKVAQGLIRKEIWVHQSRVDELKKIETKLQKPK